MEWTVDRLSCLKTVVQVFLFLSRSIKDSLKKQLSSAVLLLVKFWWRSSDLHVQPFEQSCTQIVEEVLGLCESRGNPNPSIKTQNRICAVLGYAMFLDIIELH